ncbi:atpH [Symbiodinium microadriaticum]|nr:atpH [Symbiodinium sp. KB8]CAE7687855.1 atpH [Symbiodinium microadriaticum]
MAGRAPLLSCIALFSVGLLAPTFAPSLLGFPKAKGAQQRTRSPTQLQADASGLNPFGPVVSYAKALSDAAESKGEDVAATQDMLKIKELYESEDFQDSLFLVTNDYNLTAVEQAEALIKLVQPLQSGVVPKFIVFLAKKNRLRGLKAICLEYVQSLYYRQSITPVTVRVAQRLTADQLEKLKEKMREKADTDDVKIHMEVDANLIGGLQVEWGYNDPEALYAPSHGIDLSLRRILNQQVGSPSPASWPRARQRLKRDRGGLVADPAASDPLSRFTMETETCLFLSEWEAVRCKAHAVWRKWAEDELCRQQLQIQCGSTSLQSWLSVMETQKKVLEGAAAATAQALAEVESHWRPVRLEATDGGPASWLLSAEQAKVASFKARAAQWAAPAGGSDLRKRQQALSDHVQGQVVSAVRGWDQAHAAAEAAWLSHHQRVEETSRAIAQDKAPPDSWLSEVRYREQARKHLSEQAATEELLLGAASKLHDLEAERAIYWQAFVEAYRAWSAADVPSPGEEHMMPSPAKPPEVQLPEVPDIPSAGGAVLQRVPAAMVAPGGLFGLGGGGWREGATLVLTIHGYLHLFYSDPKAATAKPEDAGPELVESDIQASVYAPMATKCVFQRRGKELILELAEPEATPPEGSPSSEKPSAAASLRKWWSGKAQEPVPRRIVARLSCPDEFKELEGRCHEFVRKGHALRAATPPRVAGASPTAGYAEAAGSS